MVISEKFQFEELDDHSREYLRTVREQKGQGMPGIFIARTNPLPALGCIFGLLILVAVAIISANIMTKEPLAVAMLQTAGLLLGGWMVIAAFRVWGAAKGHRYAGHFVYCDADTLWECAGSTVTTTDVSDVRDTRGVQNYHEGKYQHTAITLRTPNGSKNLNVKHEERARQLIVFLNMLAWMRSGGDAEAPVDGATGEQVNYLKLPAAILGGAAKLNAKTGEMPRRFTADEFDIEVDDVPLPAREGRASSGLLNYAIIIVVAIVSVLGLSQLNVGLRDDAIWDNIRSIQYEDYRAVWLRLYLKDERNTSHRSEAKSMLVDIYKKNIARMRNGALPAMNMPGPNFGPNVGGPLGPPFVGAPLKPAGGPNLPAAPKPIVPDKELLDGVELILLSLAEEAATPLIKISITEVGPRAKDADAAQRESTIGKKYIETLVDGIGPELATLYGTDGPPALIELEYEFRPAEKGRADLQFTIKYRKTMEGEPEKTVNWTGSAPNTSNAAIEQVAKELGEKTVGPKKQPGPPRVVVDGDF